MEITHIEHLGIAVKSIEEQLPYYEEVLGAKCYNIEVVEDQKVKTAFFKFGQTKIELLEPTSPESTMPSSSRSVAKASITSPLLRPTYRPPLTKPHRKVCS